MTVIQKELAIQHKNVNGIFFVGGGGGEGVLTGIESIESIAAYIKINENSMVIFGR